MMLWKMESVFLSQPVGVLLCVVCVHTCLLCVYSVYQDQPFSAMSFSPLFVSSPPDIQTGTQALGCSCIYLSSTAPWAASGPATGP